MKTLELSPTDQAILYDSLLARATDLRIREAERRGMSGYCRSLEPGFNCPHCGKTAPGFSPEELQVRLLAEEIKPEAE